jgi:CheY-like chemotaxis protein
MCRPLRYGATCFPPPDAYFRESPTRSCVTDAVVPAASAVLPKVLVIEDNRDTAESYVRLLRQWKVEARVAHGALEAVEMAQSFQPDVVLLDLVLPQLHGYEVARRLRSSQGTRRMRIIAITAWNSPADRQGSAAAGCELHLAKPVRPEVLEKVVMDTWGVPPA